jgi:hypothetical protein
MSDFSNVTWLKSCLCTQAQLQSEVFQQWAVHLREPHMTLHRKLWEWCYITQALYERDMLCPGRRGLGFAVGQEPLPAMFARLGCHIVATDLFEAQAKKAGWVNTHQHADNLEAINARGLCDPGLFQQRVTFRHVDMTRIPQDLRAFDFIWSSCSLEHLGSLARGMRFILMALQCLKPGGYAIHTTEFNVSSNSSTIEHGPVVLFRRRDIEQVAEKLKSCGHNIEVEFIEGHDLGDHFVDTPPYEQKIHLKLQIAEYVATSIGLIIKKQEVAPPKPSLFVSLLPKKR